MADAYEPIGDPDAALDEPLPDEPAAADAPKAATNASSKVTPKAADPPKAAPPPPAAPPVPTGVDAAAPLRGDDGVDLNSNREKVTVSKEAASPPPPLPPPSGKSASADVSASKDKLTSSRGTRSTANSNLEVGTKENQKKEGLFKKIPKSAYAPAASWIFFGIVAIAFAIESLAV